MQIIKRMLPVLILSLMFVVPLPAADDQPEPIREELLNPLVDSIKDMQTGGVDDGSYKKMTDSFSAEKTRVSEEMARENLMMLYGAFESFKVEKGRYPRDLKELHEVLPKNVDPDLIDKTKFGYKFGVLESGVKNYVIVANPVNNDPKYKGRYSFCVAEDLCIRVKSSGAPIDDPALARKLPAFR